jgi:hypothetical protein
LGSPWDYISLVRLVDGVEQRYLVRSLGEARVSEQGGTMRSPAPATVVALMLVTLLGCSEPTPTPKNAGAPGHGKTTFVNRVWKVSESPTIAPGQLYVFLSEGTLVVASEHGTPAFGTWNQDGGVLTMVEEGIPHPVDVLTLSQDEFRIRIKSPGEPVEMKLVPAEE